MSAAAEKVLQATLDANFDNYCIAQHISYVNEGPSPDFKDGMVLSQNIGNYAVASRLNGESLMETIMRAGREASYAIKDIAHSVLIVDEAVLGVIHDRVQSLPGLDS